MANVKTHNLNLKLKSNVRYRSYQLTLRTISFINTLPDKRPYWTIGDQLLRSTTSIGANLVEAKASSSKKEFIKYYEIALKSANETRYWLCVCRDGRLINSSLIEPLIAEAIEISKMIGSSILTLKGR